jgi:hypothetical protein
MPGKITPSATSLRQEPVRRCRDRPPRPVAESQGVLR